MVVDIAGFSRFLIFKNLVGGGDGTLRTNPIPF